MRISERLVAELTAHRTMALRALLGADGEMALVALTHALAARTFYAAAAQSCLEISSCSSALDHVVSGIAATPAARIASERHIAWALRLPERPGGLWSFARALICHIT
ncbi:MAG TPA: hypothetical protein VHU23_00750 [Rhizomicrobium sp.]|nr:hypothetical protein [Rhizomicrobium sp.]